MDNDKETYRFKSTCPPHVSAFDEFEDMLDMIQRLEYKNQLLMIVAFCSSVHIV